MGSDSVNLISSGKSFQSFGARMETRATVPRVSRHSGSGCEEGGPAQGLHLRGPSLLVL